MSWRFAPEDFRVEEIPLYAASGEGGHTFVLVEKRLRTTEEVARDLARAAGVRPRDVGYAGRKDRSAITRQWFSLPGLSPDAARALELRDAQVLEAAAHPHKLRTGHLAGNRFDIVVRGIDAARRAGAFPALEQALRIGVPNRFGAQRFGRDGDTAELGARVLRGETRVADRRRARFAVSALQAAVFNEALTRRELALDEVEVGDVAVVHRSGGLFIVEDAESENLRAATFEISPTGPIFGTRVAHPTGAPAEREAAALESFGLRLAELRAPRGIRLRGTRRALRMRPGEATLERVDDGLRLRFRLPPGCFATVLLDELLGPDDSVPA